MKKFELRLYSCNCEQIESAGINCLGGMRNEIDVIYHKLLIYARPTQNCNLFYAKQMQIINMHKKPVFHSFEMAHATYNMVHIVHLAL